MNGIWLMSYVLLWVLVAAIGVLLLGVLDVVGRSGIPRSKSTTQASDSFPAIDHDGPEIGSPLPDLAFDTTNGFGRVSMSATDGQATLLLFLSPMCESCHDVVDPLNSLVVSPPVAVRPLVIVKGPASTTTAFLKVYPLHVPVVADPDMELTTKRFDVHRNPFALYYNDRGFLVRKGTIEYGTDGLRAILGDPSASPEALMRVTPPPIKWDGRAPARP